MADEPVTPVSGAGLEFAAGATGLRKTYYGEHAASTLYECARRGCYALSSASFTFSAGGKDYCLSHIPRRYRLKVWWQERRRA